MTEKLVMLVAFMWLKKWKYILHVDFKHDLERLKVFNDGITLAHHIGQLEIQSQSNFIIHQMLEEVFILCFDILCLDESVCEYILFSQISLNVTSV